MIKSIRIKFFLVANLVVMVSSTTFAGMIVSIPAPAASGPGMGLVSVPAISTPNLNNDNQTGGGAADNNLVIPLKRFDANAFIDLVFSVSSTDGTTEYNVTEFVDNNTGVPWSSYKMQLGTGIGGSFIPFTSGSLDFDAPGFDSPPTSGSFPVVATSPYELTYTGGVQGTGAQQHVFRLDIPDALGSFTLRQIPTPVPEPGMFGLLGLLVVGAIAKRRVR
jgi:hypothetical protein